MGPKLPIYLDNNATTPIDPRVLESMLPVLKQHFGNPASATHAYGWYAAELVKIAREQVAALIHARPEEIVFTSGATESINLALLGFVRAFRKAHPEEALQVITAATEHRATLDPCFELEQNEEAELLVLPVEADGSLDGDKLAAAASPKTKIASFSLANNEIGTIFPIREMSSGLKHLGVVFHCDATQAAGKIPLDVSALSVDLLSLSAHKIYGPKGVGALYVKRELRERISPLFFGGGHEQGLRAGTLNVASIVGFGRAAEIAKAELNEHRDHLEKLSARMWLGLQAAIPKVRLTGPGNLRLPGNLNFVLPGVDNARLIGLIQNDIAISTSSACQSASKVPSHVLQAIGLSLAEQRSSVRIGIGRFTSAEEIDVAVKVVSQAVAKYSI